MQMNVSRILVKICVRRVAPGFGMFKHSRNHEERNKVVTQFQTMSKVPRELGEGVKPCLLLLVTFMSYEDNKMMNA